MQFDNQATASCYPKLSSLAVKLRRKNDFLLSSQRDFLHLRQQHAFASSPSVKSQIYSIEDI